jgi:spermidine synthase
MSSLSDGASEHKPGIASTPSEIQPCAQASSDRAKQLGECGPHPGPRRTLQLIGLGTLFVVTGFCGLTLEQVFQKLLSTVVGASTPAATIVLAVYFAGLTVGGMAFGLVRRLGKAPLRLYALLEAGVGLWTLALAALLPEVLNASARLVQLGGESPRFVLIMRLLVAGVWILPPTVAMGLTFPAIVGVVRRLQAEDVQRLAARFYGLNLLGAVLGAGGATYLLFPHIGLGGDLVVVAGLELSVAIVAFLLARSPSREDEFFGSLPTQPPGPRFLTSARFVATTVAAFCSGFLFFGLEVEWTHLIATVLGNSVFAFAIMLIMVLSGLFVGALLVSLKRLERVTPTLLAWVLLASGLVLALCYGLWDRVPVLLATLGSRASTFAGGELVRAGIAMVLVGVPSAALGVMYPMLFRVSWFPEQVAERAAGVLGAFNALGCILGALITGFVMIPTVGSDLTYRLLVLALPVAAVVLGLAVSRQEPSPPVASAPARLGILLVAGVVTAAILVQAPWDPLRLTSGVNVYFRPLHVRASSTLVFFHEDTLGGFTTVVENVVPIPGQLAPGRERVLLTNGKFQGNNGGERSAQTALAVVPILHEPVRSRALAIGLGTGHSTAVVAGAGYREIHVAEIAPGIIEAASREFKSVNRDVLKLPNVRLHVEDGRNFMLRSPLRFDLITMEISSVWFEGSTNLYSQEFYALARNHLSDRGVFQQWIQFHHIDASEVMAAIATLRAVFPHVTVWFIGGQGILVASSAPLGIVPGAATELRARPELAAELRLLQIDGQFDLDSPGDRRLLDESAVDRLYADRDTLGIVINTDSNRYLEFSTPRHNLERRDHAREVLWALSTFVPAEERAALLARLGGVTGPRY